MNSNPLVSVIVRTFNQSDRLLGDTLYSVLNQSYKNLELIIADDSTSNSSIAFIDNIANNDNRVRVIRGGERMGLVGSMNTALSNSQGAFIAILDADDIAHVDRLEKQVACFLENPDIDVLGSAMNIIDEDGHVTSTRYYPAGGFKLAGWTILRNPIGHPTAMFRADIVRKGILYNEKMEKGCEDLEFWLRLRNNGYKLCNMRDVLVDYRVCENMANKRKRDIKLNLEARRLNFSMRYLLFDSASLLFLLIRFCSPNKFLSWFYDKENRQKY